MSKVKLADEIDFGTEMSNEMKEYFLGMYNKVQEEYKIAGLSKSKNLDPCNEVEISLASNMAERVMGLISTVAPQIKNSDLVKRIHDLEKQYGILDWRVAFTIALEIAEQKLCQFKTEKDAIEVGIRTGFAYITIGTVSSCLEGFTHMDIKDRRDKKGKYFCLNFSGPVRNAGGTAAAVCVLIADYVRKKLNYASYDPDEKEIARVFCEVEHYNERCVRVQYMPSKDELDFLAKNMPIEISGDPTEKVEVPNYKNLPRIPTNIIRGGFCLVMSSCIPLKSPKLWKELSKWGKDFDMDQWNFLEDYIRIQKMSKSKSKNEGKEKEKHKIVPDFTYLADLVGGRPVLSHPLSKGGFRLRYGRSRVSGLSGQSVHPATMQILNDSLASGTQLKTERPGKAAVYTPCNVLEGPIVKLNNDTVIRLDTESLAKQYKKDIKEILFLGDVLISYGDFLNRAHLLVPPGYCEEWWVQELEKSIVDTFGSLDFEKTSEIVNIDPERIKVLVDNFFTVKPSVSESIEFSKNLKIPLHPKYTYHWKDLSLDQFSYLLNYMKSSNIDEDEFGINKIILKNDSNAKRCLEEAGVPHIISVDYLVIEKEAASAIYAQLANFNLNEILMAEGKDSLEKINKVLSFPLRDKSGTYIGARMGRPEKAKMRKLKGSPHGLFPVGEEGGKMRSFQTALVHGIVNSDFPNLKCENCNKFTIYPICEKCGSKTELYYSCKSCGLVKKHCGHDFVKVSSKKSVDLRYYFQHALETLKTNIFPDMIKGVRGTVNKEHYIEPLSKAILRAKHGLNVNKDGTVRYDATEIPITHFKPKEIGTSIKKLREMGYFKDIHGDDLANADQIVEIKCQDVILPACNDIEYPSDQILLNVTHFIDELLEKVYGQEPYYKCKNREDLIGQIIICLAPHTSAGTAARIIGFSKNQGIMAHPYLHCACRRDCDGDELGFFLLLDGFMNFSKKFLPETRGATMDAPLVLTSVIDPSGIDDMVFDMDISWRYSLDFYNAALDYKMPWECRVELIKNHLGKASQYEGHGFTHDNGNFNEGIFVSSYKTLPTMAEKLVSQMDLAQKIRAVNTSDVASLIINKHFLKDTKGNLRKFSQQEFRCVNCNTKYRRVPMSGSCYECKNGKIIFTISEGSIVKYLNPAIEIANKYGVDEYTKQTLNITKERIESIFGRDKEKQEDLNKWFCAA